MSVERNSLGSPRSRRQAGGGRERPSVTGLRAWDLGLFLVRSMGAAWALLLGEMVIVSMLAHRRLASVWELQWGAIWLAPVALGMGALCGIAGAGLWALLLRSERALPRALLALAGATFGGLAAWGVGGGRHLATAGVRAAFALSIAALGAAGLWFAAPHALRWLQKRPTQVGAALVGAIVMLELANQLVLVRLYPAFHLGLSVAALLLAPAAAAALSHSADWDSSVLRRTRSGIVLATIIAVVVAAAAAKPAAAKLAYFDNFRLLVVDHAPLGGQAVRLAAWLAPPAPMAQADEGCPSPKGCPEERGGDGSLDLRGRDLLLVTIDALRADHVGAYGYDRNTTPHIDRLAREGVRFDYAYCPTPHTSYSVTSMMTGKYMRPLLLQGAGSDSDTWAGLLRRYGYRTAGFYPPALFFIDGRNFASFRDRFLDFEYRKSEFLEGQARVRQVQEYLNRADPSHRLFVWVHLFGPHEPYEDHPAHPFGRRDIDRYDSEIADADATVGQLVRRFRERRPDGVVIVSSDHGEEFGDHGGRYHGTTVYEEQVRVPLVVHAPGLLSPRIVGEPVQTIDLLPTILAGLRIPQPARIRGRDIGALMTGARPEGEGIALAETEEYAMLASDTLRLVCARRIGACQLFDVQVDPGQHRDVSSEFPDRLLALRQRLHELSASHGRYEERGLRAEGKGWPAPILRGLSGDGDAAVDVASLLDDADREVRRKAAQVLFELKREATAPALRLALGRDEDPVVRQWSALALTRMGQGAPLTNEVLKDRDLSWRRFAALALAESGDPEGADLLVAWWRDETARDYTRSRELLEAFARIRCKDAVWPLVQTLGDVRLRPHIADTLAAIDEEVARGPLARALAEERYQSARVAIARALVKLGGEAELAAPLTRFLGVPDPLPGGVGYALEAGILEMVGGPEEDDLRKLVANAPIGVEIDLIVPRGGNDTGVRVLVRARNVGPSSAAVHVGARGDPLEYDSEGMIKDSRRLPRIDRSRSVALSIPPTSEVVEVHGVLPPTVGARAGRGQRMVVFAERGVELSALAVVPLADELPPPPPEPWKTDEETGQTDPRKPGSVRIPRGP